MACSYQHAVLPRFEAGSSELYWVTGQSKGDVSVGRLVAYNGMIDGIRPGQGTSNLQNGILGGINIKIGKMSGALRAVSLPQSQMVLAGCVLAGYTCSFTTGALEVSEQLGIQVAFMKQVKTGGSAMYGGSAINGATGLGSGGSSGSVLGQIAGAAATVADGAARIGGAAALLDGIGR